MAAVTTTLKLSLFFTFISVSLSAIPPTCNRIECPNYDLIQAGNGYEIRRYNSSLWISTQPIQEISLHEATRTGFLSLFDYIQGKNKYQEKIEMTAPVVSEVLPSDGPFCKSSFVISFYVPKQKQANPPPAKGLHVQRWKHVYAAVRQFGGFVKNTDVGEEAAALKESIAGTKWSSAIDQSRRAGHASVYSVAQYNDPLEFDNRVNEIWFLFDLPEKKFTGVADSR
ncbi:uncharacterized protein LOC131593421 [Vicia villosa]|uniref:uncharacterized protein LOC131593387 n=1 Tax=Vicia villosa TaxID=3911 RepID=UPI00273C7F18|nr:uncharacterized protein LOC131593387 [Vicia villosa]XP_058721898.1 uncharacterized protein LOC131593421 [Vicia villosa]